MIWFLDLVVDLTETEDTDKAEVSFPAIARYFSRAKDGLASSELKVRPGTNAIRLSLIMNDGNNGQSDLFNSETGEVEGMVLNRASGQVRYIKMRLTDEVRTQLARIVVHGVPAALSAPICRAIGKRLAVKVEADQQALPLPDKPREGQLLIGQTADGPRSGVFTEDLGDAGYGVDDFGTSVVITERVATLTVESCCELSVPDLTASFESRCKKAKVAPTWAALIQGNATAGSKEKCPIQTTTTLYLNEAAVDEAVAVLKAEKPPPKRSTRSRKKKQPDELPAEL